MKTSFYISVLLLLSINLITFHTAAQSGGAVFRGPSPESMSVKDSSGRSYSTAEVRALLLTGDYSVRRVAGQPNEGILFRLSDAEKAMRDSLRAHSPLSAMKPFESKAFETGAEFPSFKDRDIAGNKYNLKDLAGKVVVLNFWFINCAPCRAEMPELNELVNKYKDNKDVVFLAIALDQTDDIKNFLKTSPFDYNIISNGRFYSEKYGVNSYPTHVVIDRKRKILFHTMGLSPSTIPWLKKAVEAGLNGTELK